MNEKLEELQRVIGYRFHKVSLLKEALTHSSFSNEQRINVSPDYERLEFLGDAVLELVSSDYLFRLEPAMKEGVMTKTRASMVCEPALAFCAREINLGSYIRLGKGEELTGGRERESIVSDVLEATIGAIYLDGGFEEAKSFINRFILSDLNDKQLYFDSKSSLQELAQGKLKKTIVYKDTELTDEVNEKYFESKVYMGDELYGTGAGKNKKTAEAKAAYEALIVLRDKGYVLKKY